MFWLVNKLNIVFVTPVELQHLSEHTSVMIKFDFRLNFMAIKTHFTVIYLVLVVVSRVYMTNLVQVSEYLSSTLSVLCFVKVLINTLSDQLFNEVLPSWMLAHIFSDVIDCPFKDNNLFSSLFLISFDFSLVFKLLEKTHTEKVVYKVAKSKN